MLFYFRFRVFRPCAGLAHGVTEGRPPEDFPSPPPWGWSTGFMATPLTDDLKPFHLLRPALPKTTCWCVGLDIDPTVAKVVDGSLLFSPELSLTTQNDDPFCINCAKVPAALCKTGLLCLALVPMQLTRVPKGISPNGSELPNLNLEFTPFCTKNPSFNPSEAKT